MPTATTQPSGGHTGVTGSPRSGRGDIAARINTHVGARLRAARNLTGISQEKAGAIIGVTFQQIQKYEKGVNRVSLGTLAVFADAFDLPVTWFLEGAPGVAGESEVGNPDVGTALLSTPGGIDLASDYLAIKNHVDRAVVAQVARALAGKAGV